MAKIGIISRVVFAAVGVAGVLNVFYNMPATIWTLGVGSIVFWLVEIGAVNWGVVAFTDDDSKDILGLLGLRKR